MSAPLLAPAFRADCSACVGLCCVVPAFDAVQGFGFDKPAETPCRHLAGCGHCRIHDELAGRGFEGCVAFDCLGAGQHLTALARARFGDADWRARPEVAAWLFARYARACELQSWRAGLSLMRAQGAADADAALPGELDAAWDALDAVPPERWTDWRRRYAGAVAAFKAARR